MHRRCRSRVAASAAVFAATAVVITGLLGFIGEAATSTFIYAGCSPSKYEPGTPFETNLASLLASIATAAPNAGYNSFTAGGASNTTTTSAATTGTAAYGLYQCRGDVTGADCAGCVRDALGQLGQVCAAAYAASLQLEGCYVRYDSTNFLAGTPDAAMVYRKCSTSSSSDAGFLTHRDAVLADLQQMQGGGNGSGGTYKVSSAGGSVQGVAQCLGDVAAGDCAACVVQAVGQLKGVCGAALAADVYLAQCYVRYWANGYYFRPTQDYSQDDVGRTVAIIVGILAGLALFVVFISFLRKTC